MQNESMTSDTSNWRFPKDACDTHMHVFQGPSMFIAGRTYTPEEATNRDYVSAFGQYSLERKVIIQPSVYGTDNRTTLEELAKNPDQQRAVVTLDGSESPSLLADWHSKGVRGARLNLLFSGGGERKQAEKIADSISEFGWHLQILTDVSTFENLTSFTSNLPVPVVFDHMGHFSTRKLLTSQGFQELLDLIADGNAWAKLSAPYRLTQRDCAPYLDVFPIVRALLSANEKRLVWGSDWPHPHTSVSPPSPHELIQMLLDWLPEEDLQQQILVTNPAQLYDF